MTMATGASPRGATSACARGERLSIRCPCRGSGSACSMGKLVVGD